LLLMLLMLIGEGLVAELSMINSGGFVGLKKITKLFRQGRLF
jgi:hypothetical protein